jgi:hypothetical protein
MGKSWLKLVPSRWVKRAQHKQSDDHVTIRVDTLHLIVRETYNMGREDALKNGDTQTLRT